MEKCELVYTRFVDKLFYISALCRPFMKPQMHAPALQPLLFDFKEAVHMANTCSTYAYLALDLLDWLVQLYA